MPLLFLVLLAANHLASFPARFTWSTRNLTASNVINKSYSVWEPRELESKPLMHKIFWLFKNLAGLFLRLVC